METINDSSTNLEMDLDQAWKYLIPLKKKKWYISHRRNLIKQREDWTGLYRACCTVGLINDSRFPRRCSLRRILLDKDRGLNGGHCRGRQQAFSYRYNRILENAEWFIDWHKPHDYNFKVDFYFPVQKSTGRYYSDKRVGWVIASDAEDAKRVADLLYTPFFSHEENIEIRITDPAKIPVIREDHSHFFLLMSECIGKLKEDTGKLHTDIEHLQSRVRSNQDIEDCINLNLCAYQQNES